MPGKSLGGGGNISIFFIIRNMTFKHKYQYFHIYHRYIKKKFISFLKQCTESETIPQTFRIRNEPNPDTSTSHKERWSRGSREASMMWMKSSILDGGDTEGFTDQDQHSQGPTLFNSTRLRKDHSRQLFHQK